MKRWILFLFAAMALSAHADGFAYKYLLFADNDGNEQTLAVDQLSISFTNGRLVATNASGSQSFALASLASMKFVEEATPTAISAATDAVADGPVEAFTLSGMNLGTFSTVDQLRQHVGNGVYVVKQNGRTTKLTIRK